MTIYSACYWKPEYLYTWQVYTSACFLLSDLFVPETVIDDVWEDNSDDTSDDSEQSEVTFTTHIHVVQFGSCYMYF